MFIVGKKETEAGTVALRRHGQGDLGAKVLESAIAVLQAEVETKAVGPPGEKSEVSKRRETP
jgi:threonyl-tRNA synthetase